MRRIILIGFLLIVGHVFAAPAATVLFTQNKVTAINNGKERILSRGATLDAGDHIITTKGAVANIQYSNGTLVNIGEDSSYVILAYSPKQDDVQIKAELSKGKVEIKNTGKIKETLRTPITPLAILGTHINVYVPSSKITYIKVTEGLVLVKNTYLRAGDSVSAAQNKVVNAPFPKNGQVKSPSKAPGSISNDAVGGGADSSSSGSGSSGSDSSDSGGSGSSGSGATGSSSSGLGRSGSSYSGSGGSSSGSSGTGGSIPGTAGSNAAGTVAFVATNLGVGSSTTSAVGAIDNATVLSIISLACLP